MRGHKKIRELWSNTESIVGLRRLKERIINEGMQNESNLDEILKDFLTRDRMISRIFALNSCDKSEDN